MAGSENVSRVEGMNISAWLYAVIRIPASPVSKTDQSYREETTFVSVITVHGLGRLSRTARVVDRTVSLDAVAGPGLVSSTGVSTGKAPLTPLTPDI